MPKYETKELQSGYPIWAEIDEKDQLSKDDVGKKAWVAGEFKTKTRIVVGVHEPGEDRWPDGGVTIEEVDSGRLRYYHTGKVRLHPDNFKKKIFKSKTSILR